jgi:hypothetical protein
MLCHHYFWWNILPLPLPHPAYLAIHEWLLDMFTAFGFVNNAAINMDIQISV